MPSAICLLTGKYALLVDENTQKQYKVPTQELRRNAFHGCRVEYALYREEVPRPEEMGNEDEEEQLAVLGTISLRELWKLPSAEVVVVHAFPEEKFVVFISNTNLNSDKQSDLYLMFSHTIGSHNVHLYAMDKDNVEAAKEIRAFLADNLVEHRVDAKLLPYWAQIYKPEDHEVVLTPEYIRVKLLRRVETPSSYEAAEQAEKAAARELAAPRVADAVCTPVPAITGGAGGGKWRAIDKKGTTAAEQLISLDGGAVRYAVALPLAVLSPAKGTVSRVLEGIVGQGETLFLGDEKLDLLGPEVVVAACWQAPTEAEKTTKKKKKKEQQKEPVPRVALVLTLFPDFIVEIGAISDADVKFVSFETAEEELVKGKSVWAAQVEAALQNLCPTSAIPLEEGDLFEEGEEEFTLEFNEQRPPKVSPPKPVRRAQALLQRIRLKAEELVSKRLQAYMQSKSKEKNFGFVVREVRAPLQCHLDTFFQPPFDAPISALLAGSKQPLAPRAQLRDDQHFTEKHLLALRQRLPRRSEPVSDNAVAYLRDIHLGELLRLFRRSHRFFDRNAPAKDALREVVNAAPFDKACRSALSFVNQIFLLKALCSDNDNVPVWPQMSEAVSTWYNAVVLKVVRGDGLEKLQKNMGRTRTACKAVRSLQFHRGMLTAPIICDMYVVGLDYWRIHLKSAVMGQMYFSTQELQPYCRRSLDSWLTVDQNRQRSVTLHFINEDHPTVLKVWDVLPVWVLGVVENGEMGLRVVAVCTDRSRKAESQGWLPICSVRTASTWTDFDHYGVRSHRTWYPSVKALLDVQFPPYLHKLVTDALECAALNQSKSPSEDAAKKMSHRNVVQHPVLFTVDKRSGDSLLTDMNQTCLRFELHRRETNHPCLRQYTGGCNRKGDCNWLCFPRNACLEDLKGRCSDKRCPWRHLSKEEKKECEQETKWMEYCLQSKGFLAILWFMRPADEAGKDPTPAPLYTFLEAKRWDGLALVATLRHVPRTPMPHFTEAFAAMKQLWSKGTVRALVYPLAPFDWIQLRILCPRRTGTADEKQAWEALEHVGAPLLLKEPSKHKAKESVSTASQSTALRTYIAEQIHPFEPFKEQMAFMEAALSEDAPAHLPLMFGVAGTGKTTTLMHTAYVMHRRHPEAMVVYLAYTNQTVKTMYDTVSAAIKAGRFPGLVPDLVVAQAQQASGFVSKVKDVHPRCNFLCLTVDKFLLESDCWPSKFRRLSLLILDEMQALLDPRLLVLRFQALQLGTSDFRMVLAGDPSQLKCMLKYAPLQQDLHVDYSRRAVLRFIEARAKGRPVPFPPICLTQISRLEDPELLPLANLVYEASLYWATLTCSSTVEGGTPLPAGLRRTMALAVEGREERLPDRLRGPGVSPHTFYNKAQCDKALELCWRIAQDPTGRQWKVLLISLYDGDRVYLNAEVERRRLHGALKKVEVEVVERLGGKQADIAICVTTRTRKHHGGRPRGLLSWSRNHVVTACTRHGRCFVMIACPGWISDCWVNRLRHIWAFLKEQPSSQSGRPAPSDVSSCSSVGHHPSSPSTSTTCTDRPLRPCRRQLRVSHVLVEKCCAFLHPDVYYPYQTLQEPAPRENDVVDCWVVPCQNGRNNWRVTEVYSVKSSH